MMVLVVATSSFKFIDYNKFCSRIVSRVSRKSGLMIVNDGRHGGLGHMSISMLYSLIIALLTGRRYYSIAV